LAKANDFQGIFSWAISGDDDEFQLLEAMNNHEFRLSLSK